MDLNEFHKRQGDGVPWTREEHDAIVEMLQGYAEKGHEQCGLHDHVYDQLIDWAVDRAGHNLDRGRMGKIEFVKHMFDIAVGIGMEIGAKQAVGLQILVAASQGDKDEPRNG